MAEVAGAARPARPARAQNRPRPTPTVDALLEKVGVSAPDDKTVVINLSTPATYFTSVLALWINVPIQEKWITSPNATEAANYVGSGPFILDTWNHNSQIILKPNPNWTGDVKPTLTEIHMSMTTEPAQAQAAYEAGDLDMVLTPSEDVQRVKADPVLGPQVVEIPQLAITYYDYNNGIDPKTLKPFAALRGPQGVPDDEQGLPHRADPGHRQEGLHRRDVRGQSASRPTAS